MRRFLNRLRHRRFDDDLREEVRVHEQMKRDALRATGLADADAAAAARRAMGNTTLMREDARRVWIAPWIESVGQDVRYAVRSLQRQPLHAFASLTVLVLAIGLNTSLFTAFKGIALEPWPARDPERVIQIRARSQGQMIAPSLDEYGFIRDHATTLEGVAAYVQSVHQLQARGRGDAGTHSIFISASFLPLLGAGMHLGTGFIAEDDLPGERRSVAVLSYFFWKTHFGADAGILGQVVTLNGKPFTVIGVLEPRIDGLHREVDLWLPLSALTSIGPAMAAGLEGTATAQCCVQMIGRLAKGDDQAAARRELQLLHERFAAATKRGSGAVDVRGTAQLSMLDDDAVGIMGAIAAAVLLILVLGCANVGNLQLARGMARRREIATRMAIGASRARIVRQLLVEAMVLAGVAGALSIVVAAVLPGAAMRWGGDEIPPAIAGRFVPGVAVLIFTSVVSLLASLAFALTPALHATRATIPLGTMDRGSTRGSRFPLRSTLLAVQIASCTVLIAGAALVLRAVAHAMTLDPGFRIEGVTRVSVWLPSETPDPQREAFAQQLLSQLEAQGGAPVALAPHGPISDAPLVTSVVLPGENATNARFVLRRGASSRYFDVLGIPMVKGRMFASDAQGEAVVNEAFVRAYWPREDPLGQVLREADRRGTTVRSFTVVGVVRDAYLTGLDQVKPVVFRPTTAGAFVTRGGPATVERIRATALGLNAMASVRAWPLIDDLHDLLEESRTGAAFAWAMGVLGLVLATVGVFGVFAYAVEERRREIGVRLALGAARAHIVRMLVSSSGRAMLAGLAAGLVLSLACGPLLGSFLYGLSPLDPLAYGMMIGLLTAAGLLATLIPARRACRVDPAITLREEG